MNLQSFCRSAAVAVMGFGAAGYAALAFWHPAPARPAASLVRQPGPMLLAAAPAGATSLPPPAMSTAAPMSPAVDRLSLPSGNAPLRRPVYRSPEPRTGHPARAAGGSRDHARPATTPLRPAAELATRADQGYIPSRRIY